MAVNAASNVGNASAGIASAAGAATSAGATAAVATAAALATVAVVSQTHVKMKSSLSPSSCLSLMISNYLQGAATFGGFALSSKGSFFACIPPALVSKNNLLFLHFDTSKAITSDLAAGDSAKILEVENAILGQYNGLSPCEKRQLANVTMNRDQTRIDTTGEGLETYWTVGVLCNEFCPENAMFDFGPEKEEVLLRHRILMPLKKTEMQESIVTPFQLSSKNEGSFSPSTSPTLISLPSRVLPPAVLLP